MPEDAASTPAAKGKAPPAVNPATGLTADEEVTLAGLAAKAANVAAGSDAVEIRVVSGHSEMHYGGVKLLPQWTRVPRHMAGPLETAASDASVTIEIRELEG